MRTTPNIIITANIQILYKYQSTINMKVNKHGSQKQIKGKKLLEN